MSGRVVHVVRSDAFAGVERYVADTAGGLHRRGWRVDVIGGDPTRMRAELPAEVRHHPGASVSEVARALRVVGRCDVIHAHMTAAELPAALRKRRAGARLVVTRHFAGRRGSRWPARVAGAYIRRRVDTQIAISRFVAASLSEFSVVVHNGVRPRDPGDPVPRRERSVVTLHRLEHEKDTGVALEAWQRSGLGRQGWRLQIYGRGSEGAALRRLATELQLDASVEFAGYTDSPRRVLAGAGILLATAPAEPFGLTVLEAMAEATPVVAADGGAHRETLGGTGVFFRPGDPDDCAARLVELAGSAGDRAARGRCEIERFLAGFSIDDHVARLVELYRPDTGQP